MKKKHIITIIGLLLLLAGSIFFIIRTNNNQPLNLSFLGFNKNVSDSPKNTEQPNPQFINHGPAPDFAGITKWLNSEPLKMPDLLNKVVLINFWTYSCITCINSFPVINKWNEQYKDQGLIIIGVHTPQFTFEKVTSNLETALKRYGINYPIAQDNNYKTWSAYNNQFWPALYLVDKKGDIVYTHFGEGQYQTTELAIRKLLGLEGEVNIPAQPVSNNNKTIETFLGLARWNNFGGSETPSNEEQIYAFPKKLAKNKFALEGKWKIEPEAAVHTQGFGRIRYNFTALKAFMIAESSEPTTIKIYVDGKLQKGVTISSSDLYPIFESNQSANHTMEIEFPQGGVQVFSLIIE